MIIIIHSSYRFSLIITFHFFAFISHSRFRCFFSSAANFNVSLNYFSFFSNLKSHKQVTSVAFPFKILETVKFFSRCFVPSYFWNAPLMIFWQVFSLFFAFLSIMPEVTLIYVFLGMVNIKFRLFKYTRMYTYKVLIEFFGSFPLLSFTGGILSVKPNSAFENLTRRGRYIYFLEKSMFQKI